MTITMFISILTIGAAVTSLLTEAIKKFYQNAGKEYSANMIALINAVVVGIGGTAVVYLLMGIPFSINNIVCMILMALCVWIGAMIGFDKIIQLLKQLSEKKGAK